MKSSHQFCIALTIAVCFIMSAQTLKRKSALFLLDYIDKWNIRNPKVFNPEGGKLSMDLWLQLSSRHIQAIVRSRIADVARFLEVAEKDVVKMEIFVSGNYSIILCFLENAMKSTLLNHRSSLVLICHDCGSRTEFHLNNSHDILGDVTVAVPTEMPDFNLYGLTYDYRCQCLKRVGLGHWSVTDGFHMMTTKVTPNNLWSFTYHNAVLQILTIEMEPFVFQYDDKTGKSLPRGSLGEILHIISNILQFKFKITQSIHWGYGERTKFGNFTMGIGEFMQNNYDLGLGIYSVTPTRKAAVDFTVAYFSLEVTFIFCNNYNDTSDLWKTSFKPFRAHVWLGFALAALLLTITLKIAKTCSKYVQKQCPDVIHSPGTSRLDTNGFRDANSTRIIVTTLFILFFAFMSYYTAVLISAFTTDTVSLITLEGLVDSDYSVITTNGTNMKEVFQTSANPSIRALHTKNKIGTFHNQSVGFEALCFQRNLAFVGSIVSFNRIRNLIPSCATYPMKEILFMDRLHFITQKNQMLSKRISAVFMRMTETGIMCHIFKTESLMISKVVKSDMKKGWAEINIHHLKVPFAILATGIAISIVTLLLEVIFANLPCQ